jgi:hypothetical protein
MKTFPLIDILQSPKFVSLKRPPQLLLISLIAHYHERQRTSGREVVHETHQDGIAEYRVPISRNEIQRKFNISKCLLIRSKRELQESGVDISSGRMLSIDRAYRRKYGHSKFRPNVHDSYQFEFYDSPKEPIFYNDGFFSRIFDGIIDAEAAIRIIHMRLLPYVDIEDKYVFFISTVGHTIADVPVKVIYDKALSISEKLAIIWNLVLCQRLGYKLTLHELEKESGISERIFRKAKKHYPGLFRKKVITA